MVLHVVGGSHGTLGLSVITRPDATGWTPWSSLPKLPEPISQLDSALVTEELHVCVITATSRRLLHTFRDATGSWQPLWGDVGDAAGLTASDYELNDVAI